MNKTLIGTLSIFTLIFAFGCGPSTETETSSEPETTEEAAAVTTPTMRIQPESGDTIATIKTSHGDILVFFYSKEAPRSTENFVELAKQGKYDGVSFHRVIPDFMIQGGDFENGDGSGGHSHKGPGTLLDDEIVEGLSHKKGVLSMAKTPAPNSAGSQFFIVHAAAGTPHLDGVHSVFGFVYEGLDVVDTITEIETGASNRPTEDVIMESVTISTF